MVDTLEQSVNGRSVEFAAETYDEASGASQIGPFDYCPKVGFREYWYPGVWAKQVRRTRPLSLKMLDEDLVLFRGKDGRVVALENIDHDEHIGGRAQRISIFLSIFNVHVQRVPIAAHVDSSSYHTGRFLAAFNHQASQDNEHADTYFRSGDKRFIVRQIAGAVARRILTYMEPGSAVARGDRLGYIRFGSRVDVILPSSFELSIEIGDSVKGGETVIGYFGS